MPYLNFQALKDLVDYSERVMARVDMPSPSVLDAWLGPLIEAASSEVWYEYRDALLEEGRMKHPYNSVQAAPGRPPPALLLILSQKVQEEPRNLVPAEDWLALLDVLERWDLPKLKPVLSGDRFQTEALYAQQPPPPVPAPHEPLLPPLPPPPLTDRLNLRNIAIVCGLCLVGAGLLWWRRE